MNRADRKRQLKEDETLVARGVSGESPEIVFPLMRVLHDRVRVSIMRQSLSPLMDYLTDCLDKTGKFLRDVPIACGKGCSHCCNGWVAVTAPEAIFVAKTLRGANFDRLKTLVADTYKITGAKTHDERESMVTACPLLQDDLCTVYGHRPLVCRTAASADASICERSFRQLTNEGIPTPLLFTSVRSIYATALKGAIKRAGLSHWSYEYNAALQASLGDTNIERAWLKGEDVFANVQTEGDHYEGLYDQLMGKAFA
jgi:Fe-S-cluster containining protein